MILKHGFVLILLSCVLVGLAWLVLPLVFRVLFYLSLLLLSVHVL